MSLSLTRLLAAMALALVSAVAGAQSCSQKRIAFRSPGGAFPAIPSKADASFSACWSNPGFHAGDAERVDPARHRAPGLRESAAFSWTRTRR
jgi:hypothetical protein